MSVSPLLSRNSPTGTVIDDPLVCSMVSVSATGRADVSGNRCGLLPSSSPAHPSKTELFLISSL